jgi:hypothetical protein
MNVYRERIEQLAESSALFETEVQELVTCAGAAGVTVSLERVDLTDGSRHTWTANADGTVTGRRPPAQGEKVGRARRVRRGVAVVGEFKWEVPSEV